MPETRTLPHDGNKIRELRERAGLSRAELGRRIGRHPQSLRNIEINAKNASVVTLAKIAKALGVELRDIAQHDEATPIDETDPARRSA